MVIDMSQISCLLIGIFFFRKKKTAYMTIHRNHLPPDIKYISSQVIILKDGFNSTIVLKITSSLQLK